MSERLLTQAVDRGFGVSVYRATAVIGSTATDVPEPEEDMIRRGLLDMVEAGAIPTYGAADAPPFTIDLTPVNYLIQCMVDLADSEELRPGPHQANGSRMPVYHITNPSPLPLAELPAVMPRLRPDGGAGGTLPLPEWTAEMQARAKHDERLRLRVMAMKAIFDAGHVMFALDRRETQRALDVVGEAVTCPPVDETLLRRMMLR